MNDMAETPAPTPVAVVVVKSAWVSKINWLQLGALLLNGLITLVSGQTLGLDPAMQVKLLAGLQAFQSIATIVLKIWFTPTITPQSLEK